jgi:hypothetical protein
MHKLTLPFTADLRESDSVSSKVLSQDLGGVFLDIHWLVLSL